MLQLGSKATFTFGLTSSTQPCRVLDLPSPKAELERRIRNVLPTFSAAAVDSGIARQSAGYRLVRQLGDDWRSQRAAPWLYAQPRSSGCCFLPCELHLAYRYKLLPECDSLLRRIWVPCSD